MAELVSVTEPKVTNSIKQELTWTSFCTVFQAELIDTGHFVIVRGAAEALAEEWPQRPETTAA